MIQRIIRNDPAPPPARQKQQREWAPRFWLGCDYVGLWKLLGRNRFRISPSLWPSALFDLYLTAVHPVMRLAQNAFVGRRVARTRIEQPPVFILGHWRCGTTMLHEMLILDERNTFPTTYDCLCPSHFLMTARIFKKMLWFLLPSRRPMDNMPMGWDRPQEDEFALANLGLPSPYLTIAFPNERPAFPEYLDLEDVPEKARDRWKRVFLRFLQEITYRKPGRMVLKSPTHTCRVPTLLEMFPDARFIYLTRNPYAVFPSTVHLWKSLYETHGFQVPTFEGLEQHVIDTFAHMHRRFEATRELIPAGRLYELRYEDLVADPIYHLKSIYEELDLGDVAPVLPAAQEYLEQNAGYQTNRYRQLPVETCRQIARHWGDYLAQHGYAQEPLVA